VPEAAVSVRSLATNLREGTLAAQLECWPEELIEERHQRCLELVDRIAVQKRSKLVGGTQDVLIEESVFGRTQTNYKVHVHGDVVHGETVSVLITNAQRATLEGQIQNGNVTFENFREENSRARACSEK
jgi:tRNA A37 methylthiotransferase MiaB